MLNFELFLDSILKQNIEKFNKIKTEEK